MQCGKYKPNEGADLDGAKKEYGGFLTTLVKEGDILFVGDSIIVIKSIKANKTIVAIRAPVDYIIKKTVGGNNG